MKGVIEKMAKKWQDTCNCAGELNSTWQRVDTKEDAGEYPVEVILPDGFPEVCFDCGKEIVRVTYFRNLFAENRNKK